MNSDRIAFLLCLCIWLWTSQVCGTAVENRLVVSIDDLISTPIDAAENKAFLPHRANTSTGEVVAAGQYENAAVCGGCHQTIYEEWRSSIMAYAWDDPIYRALLKRASIATEGKVDKFCTGCHTPIGLMTGKINSEVNRRALEPTQTSELPGVDCEACHNIKGISGIENGSYVMDAPVSGNKIKRGPRDDANSPYHFTEYSSLHTHSEFCGTCHNVTHPFNDVPIERTYDEWYESSYRMDNIGCQNCHMQPVSDKSAIMGPERADRATHFFAAANTTVMRHFGEHENVERARTLLQSAARIELENVPSKLTAGQSVALQVKVQNVGAGHKLPTGFPEGREVWLDFTVQDVDGREIYRLGRIENGKTEPGTKNFKVHLGDKDGNEVDVEIWKVAGILSDNRLLPKGSQLVDFQFYLPETTKGPIKIITNLYYWPFSQAFADHLLGENAIKVSVEKLATAQIELQLKN